ncbi:flavin reductase family protein [Zhongshania sp.]|uniref:flavin reductase family protein n=1 Tax=Zhongshania sp. TaxID=1971902 RepID=UPI003568CAB3
MNSSKQVDTTAFRNALGAFTTGVTVVSTRSVDGRDVGLTANSFNSVSLEPPMVLWSLGKSALSLRDFQAADYFAVHVLAEDQIDISNVFAKRGVDKFANKDLERGPNAIPLLTDCAARFICKTSYQYEGGDHIIFVGEVIEFCQFERNPLLFHAGQYGQLQRNSAKSRTAGSTQFDDASLGYLLRYCSHKLLSKLKAQLIERKLSVNQYYFLALVAKSGRTDLNTLIDVAAQGDNSPNNDEIEDLIARGYLQKNAYNIEASKTGARLHLELFSFYTAEESTALNLLDYDTQQTLRIALGNVAESFAD